MIRWRAANVISRLLKILTFCSIFANPVDKSTYCGMMSSEAHSIVGKDENMGEIVQMPLPQREQEQSEDPFDLLADAILATAAEHREKYGSEEEFEQNRNEFNKALFERLAADGVDLSKL
jgi:hypothetical protein